MPFVRTRIAAAVVAATTAGLSPALSAQETAYPARPVRLVIPFSPGGGTDLVGRMVAQKLTESWGQQVVVDNKAGANGTIGADLVAKSAPDGHTLCMFTASHSVNVTLQGVQQPYDVMRDFTPLNLLATQPYVLVVKPSLPVRSVGELVALAKAKPGSLAFGSSGVGGLVHLSAELFASLAGIKVTHVPYKGGAQAMMDVVAGNVDFMFTSLNQSNALIEAGRLRLLAVTTPKRNAAVKQIPTMQEAGVAGYVVESWYGMAAPAGLTNALVTRINGDINRVLKMPDVAERFATDGATPAGGTPVQFRDYLRSEIEKWRRTIQAAGITPGV